jgi:hypothetical protein
VDVRAGNLRPAPSISPEKDDEAFATYVAWASEELRREAWPKLSIGLAKIPMGLEAVPLALQAFDDAQTDLPALGPENQGMPTDGVSGVGLKVTLPAGLSYELHYGSGRADSTGGPFEGLNRSLSADISRIDVTRAYGGILRWRTPLEGFTLRGGISQVQLNADAVTVGAPLWSRVGVGNNTHGRLFNTVRTWRAAAEQRIGDLKLSAEYMQSQVRASLDDGALTSQIGEGYSGRAAYRVADWLQLGSSYSLYFADRNDRNGEALAAAGRDPAAAWIRDIGVSAKFNFNRNVALQVEGHLMNGLLGVVEGSDEDWRRFGAKMTIQF